MFGLHGDAARAQSSPDRRARHANILNAPARFPIEWCSPDLRALSLPDGRFTKQARVSIPVTGSSGKGIRRQLPGNPPMLQILAIAPVMALSSAASANARAPKAEHYPLPAGQSVADKGSEVVRAGFVDGYGNQAGVVALMRRPSEEPRGEVRNASGVTMATTASLETWERMRSAAVLLIVNWCQRAIRTTSQYACILGRYP